MMDDEMHVEFARVQGLGHKGINPLKALSKCGLCSTPLGVDMLSVASYSPEQNSLALRFSP